MGKGHEGQYGAYTDKKLKLHIYWLHQKFNELVLQILDCWAEALSNWKKPVEIPTEGLFKLELDHLLHQSFGPIDEINGVIPSWQRDESFSIAVNAMHTLKGVIRELEVLKREQQALQVWAHEENFAILHVLHEAGAMVTYVYCGDGF
jgi:hypothetical protein